MKQEVGEMPVMMIEIISDEEDSKQTVVFTICSECSVSGLFDE